MEYILSFDLSLSNTGVSIFLDDGQHIDSLSIATNSKDETRVRLHQIAEKFIQLKQKYNPKTIVLEQGFTRFNTSTQQLYRVHGICNYIFWDCNQIYYPSTTIKKTICGKGNVKKNEVETVLKNKFDVSFDDFDQSDSFAIALTYFYKEGILE